jgi:hypothetical protein
MTLACYCASMKDQYLAFMLRLWQVGHGEGAEWRASLEDPHTGELRAFASLGALVAFLEEITRDQPDAGTLAGDAGAPPGHE